MNIHDSRDSAVRVTSRIVMKTYQALLVKLYGYKALAR